MDALPWLALTVILAACSTPSVRAASTRELRLMSYNLNYGNPDWDSTLDAIDNADADVVLLQEVTSSWKAALAKRFDDKYPHQKYRVDGRAAGGLAVLSKLPIDREELWPAPAGTGAWFPLGRVVIAAPFGKVQLLNVHLRPALDSRGWVTGYLTTPPIRRAEIEAHWKRVTLELPTIVIGDFNEEPDGKAIEFLTGKGLARVPTSGPKSWRYVRDNVEVLKLDIDHVMIDDRLTASNAHVVDAGASDHRPVVVTIAPK
ncbi:MAG: endonuclease/exonuclease/phosphatase family protein [Kofleriaceae bacterium]